MDNQEVDTLIQDYLEVTQAILQLTFILSLIQSQLVRLTSEGNNQEQIDALIQDYLVIQRVILQLAFILSLIQSELVRLTSEEEAA
jgi:hypothetical protein